MNILASMNADTTLQIAGILHDVVEDTDATIENIKELFGTEVADLVGSHSEDKSKSWKERKEADIKETANGTRSLKLLVMADKVSNLRALYKDAQELKDKVWERFNAPKEMQAWYYSKMIDALEEMQYGEDSREVYWEIQIDRYISLSALRTHLLLPHSYFCLPTVCWYDCLPAVWMLAHLNCSVFVTFSCIIAHTPLTR